MRSNDHALASVLVRDELALYAPAVRGSEMIAQGMLIESVAAYVAAAEDVVAVFNEAGQRLVDADIDPQVRPLRLRRLPLWRVPRVRPGQRRPRSW